jgi:hypothetical protein
MTPLPREREKRMPWYSTERLDQVAVLRLKGDASKRVYQWLGGLDGLMMRGHRHMVVSLEQVTVARATHLGFLGSFAQHLTEVDGELVFVPPVDAGSRALVEQTGSRLSLRFAPTVELGIADLALPQR